MCRRGCRVLCRPSKTRYLQQARNAKAMADALAYTAEPVKPKQAAMDAAMAYKAGQQGAWGGGDQRDVLQGGREIRGTDLSNASQRK